MRANKAALAIGALIVSMTASAQAAELDYGSVAILSCKDYLEAYDTDLLASLVQSVSSYLSKGDSDHKSLVAADIGAYIGMECRLHEDHRIGIVVEDLVSQKRRGRLPALPIGDPAQDPRVEAQWEAFYKWLHHGGPRPRFR